jgi:SRSO17 transposase
MERRFRVRLDELLDDAEVPPGLLRGLQPRLESFLQPFVLPLQRDEQRQNARHYVQGLLSCLPDKNVESIAYLHDEERQALQKFIGQSPWDHRPLLAELARQVGADLGQPDGVLVFDPSAFPKKGAESVGVARQWCGRLGKVDNCQVGVYLGYVSSKEHALVDFRLYLPREWTRSRQRLNKAGVPREVRFRTRHELALEMLDGSGVSLPHGWVAGDDEMGRCSWFRGELRQRGENYLLAVPSNTLVRDLAAPEPEYRGQGRRPGVPFARVDSWRGALPEDAWETVEVRDGEKGPLVVQGVRRLVQARTEGRPAEVAELLVVFRERQADGTWKHDYLLAHGPLGTPLAEFARVLKAEHRVEECLRRAKGKAGLADYQVRTWEGWHHHQALALLATWFLTVEARRGKKADAGVDGAAAGDGDWQAVGAALGQRWARAATTEHGSSFAPQRGGPALPLEATQPLAPSSL